MYQVKFIDSVLNEDIPKLQHSGKNLEILYRSLKKLETNPYSNSRAKSGDLSNIRGMDWGKGYRILFRIDEADQLVVVISIDSHESAYRKAKRRNDT